MLNPSVFGFTARKLLWQFGCHHCYAYSVLGSDFDSRYMSKKKKKKKEDFRPTDPTWKCYLQMGNTTIFFIWPNGCRYWQPVLNWQFVLKYFDSIFAATEFWLAKANNPGYILTKRCPLGLHILWHFFSMSPLKAGEPAKFSTKLITMMSYNSGLSFCKEEQ